MTINWVRGFRRIGSVVILPFAALIVLAFYENTKVFNPSSYVGDQFPKPGDLKGGYDIWLPNLGPAHFSEEVPRDIASKVVADFTKGWPAQDPDKAPYPAITIAFTVHKHVSNLRLAGLILGAFIGTVLVVQGSISILAWALRGFKS